MNRDQGIIERGPDKHQQSGVEIVLPMSEPNADHTNGADYKAKCHVITVRMTL